MEREAHSFSFSNIKSGNEIDGNGFEEIRTESSKGQKLE